MDLPFNVELHYQKNMRKRSVLTFYSDKYFTQYTDEVVEIKEFQELSLVFESSNKEDKLYISELDDFPIQGRKSVPDNGKFFEPNTGKVSIFSYSEPNKQIIPLIPGYYHITIVSEERKYFSWFKITPKDLSEAEWELMRREIEESVKGLSTDFTSKYKQENKMKNENSFSHITISKIETFVDSVSTNIATLESIKREARYKISKEYTWKPIGSKTLIDTVTIKKAQEHPEKKGFLYSPTRVLEYNIIDNQWLKFMLNYFKRFSSISSVYLEEILISIKTEYNKDKKYWYKRSTSQIEYSQNTFTSKIKNIEEQQKLLKKFYAVISEFLDLEFLKKVSASRPRHIPKSLVLNPKYNAIYKTYLNCIRDDDTLALDKSYKYYWKRTDVLYEIWCFIKVLESLINIGYVPKSGWIYEEEYISNHLLPFLQDETKVIMEKGNMTCSIVFNEVLPNEHFSNSTSVPLKTSSWRKKPDIRIDIFENRKAYLGSILLDAKYKKLYNIIKNDKSGEQIQQLRAYRNDTMSSVFAFPNIWRGAIKVVQAVFALYPSKDEGEVIPESFNEDNIYFSSLRPGESIENFSLRLEHVIDKRIEQYSQVLK